ncbi:hypothetical protein GGS21DRAFT_508263 [Xylaria nigripes]|nr:hypothetical protein GGS21DRAFT_508263 [Xylaria nigripes]
MASSTSESPEPHSQPVEESTDAIVSSSFVTSHLVGLLGLPTEITDAIVSYLAPLELARLSSTCRHLCDHAMNDAHWRQHVLANLPGNNIKAPYPCTSWRQLFIVHHQHWFLTRNKLWFCDRSLTGQLALARYDERRGCIEAYQLLAISTRDDNEPWAAHPGLHIHHFEPKIKLHLDKPILNFNVDSWESLMRSSLASPDTTRPRHFFREQPIRSSHRSDPRFSSFVLAKPLEEQDLHRHMSDSFPYSCVWPPPTIPASHRVMGHPADIAAASCQDLMDSPKWMPRNNSEVSHLTFRIRQWMQLGPPSIGFHFGEEILTYSTLDPSLYTPTKERPWRGIWVGDYSVHGCEFLLFHQPDYQEGHQAPLEKRDSESDEEFQARFLSERVYRGRLEAIKLTGDPNVPRGECTFVADDIGENGFVGIAQGSPFSGARIVKSRGHVAGAGFARDKYIQSELILISHDRLAQHWLDFGHISFFERVDIDQFLAPS